MTEHSQRNSPPTLWDQATQLWRDLTLGFGDAVLILRWGVMRALYHRALGHELREIEAIVRRAVRDEAEAFELPPLNPRAKRQSPSRQQDGLEHSRQDRPRADPEDPMTWPVVFRMTPRIPCKHIGPREHSGPRKRKEPLENRPCRNYALRIEAVRRVIWHPDAFVLRYARHLARKAQASLRVLADFIDRFGPRPEADPSSTTQHAVAPPNAKLIEPG